MRLWALHEIQTFMLREKLQTSDCPPNIIKREYTSRSIWTTGVNVQVGGLGESTETFDMGWMISSIDDSVVAVVDIPVGAYKENLTYLYLRLGRLGSNRDDSQIHRHRRRPCRGVKVVVTVNAVEELPIDEFSPPSSRDARDV